MEVGFGNLQFGNFNTYVKRQLIRVYNWTEEEALDLVFRKRDRVKQLYAEGHSYVRTAEILNEERNAR